MKHPYESNEYNKYAPHQILQKKKMKHYNFCKNEHAITNVARNKNGTNTDKKL
jgi:hypothetical protein